MNKFQVIANGQILDTYDNLSVSMNYQVEDILDITKKTTNYSKTITLPGTPFNNKFFKQLFEVNIDTITFNPKKSIPSIIRVGESEVMKGSMQLLNIIVNNKQVDYEVVVVGQLKSIVDVWGDLGLENLDLSEYNHIRSKTNIINSWTYTIKRFGSDVSIGEGGTGYVYPYIIYGQHNDVISNLYTSNLFPAVYVKTIIDKMFELAGYTYASRFFNGEYFKKLIIPFVDDKLELPQDELEKRTTRIGVSGVGSTLMPPVGNGNSSFDTSVNTGFKYASPIRTNWDDCPNWYKNYSYNNYWLPLDKVSGTTGSETFLNPGNQWTFSNTNGAAFSKYTCGNSGYYDINFVADAITKFFEDDGNDIDWKKNPLKVFARIIHTRNGVSTTLAETDFPISYTPGNTGSVPTPYVDLSGKQSLDCAKSNVYLLEGDLLRIGFGFEFCDVSWEGLNDEEIKAGILFPDQYDNKVTMFEVKPSNNNIEGVDDEINMNQVLPDIKLKDFFVSILKMFNLVSWDDPTQPNNIIIEPRDDFYASRQRVLDWTYKLDNSQDVKITPMSELDAAVINYSYKEDSDYFNEQYTNETKKIYGEYEISVDNDFSNKVQELDVLFSPTPDASYAIGDRVAPEFVSIEETNLKPKKVKPRILFYGGLKNTTNPYRLRDFIGQPDNQSVLLNQYAYCGMWDDPTNPTFDLGFGSTEKVYYLANEFPVRTLVEEFHKNTLLDIIDINSKLLEANFVLTPKDIADLDFRDIILIDNAYWRLNKIKDYNPIGSDKTTEVLLYKLNNISIFAKDRIVLSQMNKGLPRDIIKVWTKKGMYFKSRAGDVITADNCKALGGEFIGGACWGGIRINDYVMGRDGEPTSNVVIKGGTNTTPVAVDRPVEMNKGQNSIDSPGVIVRGTGNNVGVNVKSGLILGNNNSVPSTFEKVIIIGDNITPIQDNTIYVGNYALTPEGLKYDFDYIIDGGENVILPINKTNYIDLIDGGFNDVRSFGGDSKERPIIDGGDDLSI
jgi:hypothetical protein